MTKALAIIDHPPTVFIKGGSVFANSRDVATFFEKRHDNVLRDILSLVAQGVLDFEETPYVDPQNGRTYLSYDMGRDGFSLLSMGFTGSKALRWKLRYIEAFNAMEKELAARVVVPVIDLNDPAFLRQTLLGYTERVIALESKVEVQQAQIAADAPKAQFYDEYADAKGMTALTDIGRVLRVGPIKLLRWLVEQRVLFRTSSRSPLRARNEYLKKGWFVAKVTVIDGVSRTQTMAIPRGIQGVAEMMGRRVDLFGRVVTSEELPLLRH